MASQTPFLTDDEILQMVKPLSQPAAIMRWFRGHGFPDVKQRPNGLPLLSRAYFDAVTTAGMAPRTTGPAPAAQPNIDAFRQRYGTAATVSRIK